MAGEGGFPRYLNNTRSLIGEVLNNGHDDSQIFSGALWDTREDLEQNMTDELVFKAMEDENPTTLEEFFNELLKEDDIVYSDNYTQNGTPHSAYIQNSFAKHGMYYDPEMVTMPDDYSIKASLNTTDLDDFYKFNISSTDFAAIGIKPLDDPRRDYDVYVYSDINMQNEVNHSIYEANNIDFVVVNGHTVGNAVYYANVTWCSGNRTYKVEAEFDIPTLSTGTASYSMIQEEVFDLYEVNLTAGTMYKINVTPVYDLDVGVYLLNETGGRDFAKAESDRFRKGIRETVAFKPSKNGYYAVVVTNENGESGDYDISFSSVSENCGSYLCSNASEINLETTQICNLSINAIYNLSVPGTEDIGVYLEVPKNGDYDLSIYSDYQNCFEENPYCYSATDGTGADENCSITDGGVYYIEVLNQLGSGTFQLHVGNDSNSDGYPGFIDPCDSNADENGDGIISDFELLHYINSWANGTVSDFELLNAIDQWADRTEGCLKGRPSTKVMASISRGTAIGTAGATADLNLTLTVNESYGLNSITVTEQIPPGWNLTSSSPTADSFNITTGKIKWNLRGSNVSDMVINYTIFIPADETSNRTVSGNTKYIDEGSNVLIETTGNSSVIVNRTCATGINPPASGEWKIDQATECEDADICLSEGGDFLSSFDNNSI